VKTRGCSTRHVWFGGNGSDWGSSFCFKNDRRRSCKPGSSLQWHGQPVVDRSVNRPWLTPSGCNRQAFNRLALSATRASNSIAAKQIRQFSIVLPLIVAPNSRLESLTCRQSCLGNSPARSPLLLSTCMIRDRQRLDGNEDCVVSGCKSHEVTLSPSRLRRQCYDSS